MIPTTLVLPLTSEFGIGGIGGFCVGYSLKKITKIVFSIIAVSFLGLQYLAQKGIIMIDYLALEEWVLSIFGETSALQGFFITLITQMPFGFGFAGGLFLGLKKG
ncbi:MAG: FUN14 domain-containing protein [Candidatus Kariarchaeaceae archaeon]|jgi:uncharacterized membrane protein (Fun14 family)